ncbi:DUF3298 and DUF4163 domain-containing protein [Pseudoflavonifractor phocaeensis]|uniref:DUF3298 and DUF4163 domain-containing protein n=1 Tax=Pseudoflavonifractor phocaeensis TaxID=1870988 RepID=UPI00210BE497|nr:DUF3298 and DUF4163 domain-containing protein [Pseudoflavonifractor phocaeensis]MCQ4863647.1 DUF3298 and DUF4163 domain-containing protein [Pseudoflavonifractor phocaeensis]
MMNEKWSGARARYEAAPVPEELNFAVAAAVRAGGRERKRRRVVRRSLATLASCCACFVLLVNVSPVFARAVYEMPVLGSLARVVTVTQYAIEDKDHLIDVRLPALENTGNTDLEQRINLEIQTRINGVLAEAEDRARQTREAYMATGGAEEDFIPIIISVDYEIKCQNERCLSFILTKTETIASAYTEIYCYNIDLETGKELTLQDVLGPGYREIANAAVRTEIDRRIREEGAGYFDGTDGVEGFQSVTDGQLFYINGAGNPVVLFEKYEIAPGYMGTQEFEIAR